jgi:DNA-binding transcriptional LysR family regulator
MDLRQLRYFVAVAELQNVHRASERLHVAPSGLSRGIRELEDSLGMTLFQRDKRRLRLSDAGTAFLPHAQSILLQVDLSEQFAGRFTKGHVGTLKFGLQEIAGRHRVIPQSFQQFRRQFPDVDIRLSIMTTIEQVEAISSNEIDAGFFYIAEKHPEFKYLDVDVDNWLLAAPRSHPVAKKAGLHLRDLTNESFVFIPRPIAPILFDRLMAVCAKASLVPRIVQEAKGEATLLDLVAVGMGLSFVTSTAIGHAPADVVLREVAGLSLPLTMTLAWRKDNASPALRLFLEVFQALLKKRP